MNKIVYCKEYYLVFIRVIYKWVFAFILLLTFYSCNSSEPESNKLARPNLLIVFPDEMRYHAMGFVGEEPVLTPNLDSFAEESLVLNQAVSNYPLCSPFRAMLMTGKYAHSNGVVSNCNSARPKNELNENDTCWSDVLQRNGYNLGYIGKWHLDAPYKPYVDTYNNSPARDIKWNEWCSPSRRHGFDFWHSYGTYDRHMNPMYWNTNAKRDDFHYVDKWGPEHEADKVIEYLKNPNGKYRDNKKPFALAVSINPPHSPYDQVPEKYLKLYDDLNIDSLSNRPNLNSASLENQEFYKKNIRSYYAMVSGIDEQLGRILKALKDEGLDDNTIVLFMSDHGCCLGMHGEKSKNNPYEESMRIPFIIRWPGVIPSLTNDILISVPDYYPTLLDLMGLGGDIPTSVQGKSYASIFKGEEGSKPDFQVYLRMNYDSSGTGARGIRTNKMTLSFEVEESGISDTLLYNNINDRFQLNNLAALNPDKVDSLKNMLVNWMEITGDPALMHFR